MLYELQSHILSSIYFVYLFNFRKKEKKEKTRHLLRKTACIVPRDRSETLRHETNNTYIRIAWTYTAHFFMLNVLCISHGIIWSVTCQYNVFCSCWQLWVGRPRARLFHHFFNTFKFLFCALFYTEIASALHHNHPLIQFMAIKNHRTSYLKGFWEETACFSQRLAAIVHYPEPLLYRFPLRSRWPSLFGLTSL